MGGESLKNSDVYETDVLVIGGGGAGLAAALSAAEEKKKVLLVEKSKYLGGTTALSIGSITASGTKHQKRKRIHDSPEAFFEDIGKYNAELDVHDNKELCWVLVREAEKTIEWLQGFGFEFFGPSPEPPHRVPRMHNVIPNASAFPVLLQRAARKNNVKFLTDLTAHHLLQYDGRVIGAILYQKTDNAFIEVRARLGVILACGDFSGSDFLKRKYWPSDLAEVNPYNPNCQGEGHLMGSKIGGHLVNMSVSRFPNIRFIPAPKRLWNDFLPTTPLFIKLYGTGSRFLPKQIVTKIAKHIITTRGAPDAKLYKEGAILVNNKGERFTNELKDPSIPLSKQPKGQAYIVFDSLLARKFTAWPYYISTAPGIAHAYLQDYEKNFPDVISRGNTLEDAAKNHPRSFSLVEAVRRYNRFVEKGKDDDFQRLPLGEGILEPPFYILGPAESYIGVSIGGLSINSRFEVLREDGKVISGLFAVGRTGGGLILSGHGLNLAWALTSGRLAGKFVAQNK